jgi:hypothetical protein
MLHQQSEQINARFRDNVEIKKMVGDEFAYDGLGSVEAKKITGRNALVVFSDIEHLRRKIVSEKFSVALPIDKSDIVRMLLNPEGKYAAAIMRAMERRFDRVVVEAAFADVYTGKKFLTQVTSAADGVVTVNATGGLVFDKLLEINQNFIDKEVGLDIPEKLIFAISGKEQTALLNINELTSGDYSRKFVLDSSSNMVQNALGLNIITFGGTVDNPILNVSGGVRDCIATSTRGICVGISREFDIQVQPRHDLHDTVQVIITGEIGAVRTEGILVQKIQTNA